MNPEDGRVVSEQFKLDSTVTGSRRGCRQDGLKEKTGRQVEVIEDKGSGALNPI